MLSRQMADLGQYGWRLPSSGGDLASLLGGRGFCREASLPINHGLLADVFARDEDVLFSRLVEEILCFVVIIESSCSEERDVSCADENCTCSFAFLRPISLQEPNREREIWAQRLLM